MARYDGQERHDRHDHRRGGNVNSYFRDVFVFVSLLNWHLIILNTELITCHRGIWDLDYFTILYILLQRGIRNLEVGILTFVLYCFINKESGIWNLEHML